MMSAQLQKPSGASQQNGDGSANGGDLSAQLAKTTLSEQQPLKNRAGQSNSPYVRAHSDSPVAWQLLDNEAVERAKRENKPIFMNVGFRACHYCRLTSQDSFSHPSVASLLNSFFIPIIVDREERPDVDSIYMNYIQAVNGAGGWPLNVFLTPELEPVFGGTYWPGPGADLVGINGEEVDEDERLDFLIILQKLQQVWQEQESRCRKEAKEILSQLRDFAAEGTFGARPIGIPSGTGPSSAALPADAPGLVTGAATNANLADLEVDLDQLEEAYTHIAGTYDAVNGGFGLAPKFATPAKLSFLLKLAHYPPEVKDVVGEKEVEHATEMALHTLRRLRDGGLRDHVGAGFMRYSATEDWAMPHFEKMVLDNALLLGVYLDAWLSTAKGGQPKADDEFADVVFELAEYLTTAPIGLPDGGFATSEAADSFYRKGDRHMREGAYYLWTRREFENVVSGGDSQESAVAAAHWNVWGGGNVERNQDPNDEFINQNVLRVVKDASELEKQFGVPKKEVKKLIASAKQKLLAHREKERVRPVVDDKAVTSINAMVIASLARLGAAVKYLDAAKGGKYLAAASKAAKFIRQKLWDSEAKVLYRTYLSGRGPTKAFAEDYAFLIEALLELYEATADEGWLAWADELQKIQTDLFYDTTTQPPRSSNPQSEHSSCGGFYTTPEDDRFVILRLKDGMDTVQPSTNAVSASNLFRLSSIFGDSKYAQMAREAITAFEVEMLQYPWLFVGILGSVVSARLGGKCWIVEAGRQDDAAVRTYLLLPRAGLRSLIYHGSGSGSGSFLAGRNPLLGELRGKSGSAYHFNNGSYEPYAEAKLEK